LGFLLVLFIFVGNKCNEATIVKRTKEGTKEGNKALGDKQSKRSTIAVGQELLSRQGYRPLLLMFSSN